MSKIMVPQYVDDLTGERLGENGTTIAFAFQGHSYEIDLSPDNAKKMTNALGEYIDHARRAETRGRRRSSGMGATSDPAHKEETRAARAWLVEQGILSADSRGRISAENMERYRSRGQQAMLEPEAEPTTASNGNSPRRSRKQAKEEATESVSA